MKKYNEKTAAAVINSLLKCVRKTGKHTLLCNVMTDNIGRACVCDGYRFYCLKNLPAAVDYADPDPEGDEFVQQLEDRIFKSLRDGDVVQIPAPDPDELKSFITASLEPAAKSFFDIGAAAPLVNAAYLRDTIRLFPGAVWYVSSDPYKRMINPVYVVSEYGTAAILPCRDPLQKPFNPQDTITPGRFAATFAV